MKKRRRLSLGSLCLMVLLVFFSLLTLIPLLNILAKALSHPNLVHLLKGYHVFPRGFSLINFQMILKQPMVIKSVFNSFFITVIGVCINILLTTSAAYVLTRPGLVGKKFIMYFLIIMMIFEPGTVQEYFLMKDLHLLDQQWSMILYKSVNVYYLIILMRFMEGVPDSIVEAATIDGAGHGDILFKVLIPLCKAPILTVGMFYGTFRWNEFFKSSIFLTSKNNMVLQVLLRKFVVDSETQVIISGSELMANNIASLNNGSLKAATIVIAVLPILLIFPIVLKYYTKDALAGGVKQ